MQSGFATLHRGRLRSLPKVENEARWAARGLETADGSDVWFKAHPKEEPMNHSLVAVRHRARLGHGEAPRAEPEGRE